MRGAVGVGRERAVDAAGREQFRRFVAARSGGLLRTAYLLAGNLADAEDLLQTALARTYLRYDRIRDPGALEAYVRRTLLTTQLSVWRRRRRGAEYPSAAPPERGAEEPGYGAAADRDALWQALGRLGPRQRAVVVLRYYEDCSEAETAALLGISPGTVKSQAARALSALRCDAALAEGRDPTRLGVRP